jgi:hypothetical protein
MANKNVEILLGFFEARANTSNIETFSETLNISVEQTQ